MGDISMRYFSRDVDLQKDRKFTALRRKYGYWAIAVYEELLCLIYADKGYYIEYNEDTKDGIIFDILTDFQGKYQPSIETVESIISDLAEYQLFSGCHFKSGYITSHRIQEQFYRYTVERKNVEVDTKVWLLTEKEMSDISTRSGILSFCKNQPNFNENRPNFEENQPNFDIKESKGKEIKENKIKDEDKAEEKTEGNGKAVVVFDYYRNNINPLPTKTEIDELNYWLDLGFEERLVKRCIEIAALSNKRSMKYIAGILRNLDKKGIKTLKAFESAEKIRESEKANIQKTNQKINQNANVRSTKFSNFQQRQYDENKLKKIQEMQRAILDDFLNEK